MIKKAYRVLKRYPGLDSKIEVGDILIRKDQGSFYYLITEDSSIMCEEHIYITVDVKDTDFFQEVYLKIEITEKNEG